MQIHSNQDPEHSFFGHKRVQSFKSDCLISSALYCYYCILVLAAWRARERGGPAEGGAGRGHEGGGGHEAEAGGPHPVLQQEGGRAPETARPPECQVQYYSNILQ